MKTHKPFDKENNIIFKDTKGNEHYLEWDNDWQTLKPVPKQMTKAEMSKYIDWLIDKIKYARNRNTDLINEIQYCEEIIKRLHKKSDISDGTIRAWIWFILLACTFITLFVFTN